MKFFENWNDLIIRIQQSIQKDCSKGRKFFISALYFYLNIFFSFNNDVLVIRFIIRFHSLLIILNYYFLQIGKLQII